MQTENDTQNQDEPVTEQEIKDSLLKRAIKPVLLFLVIVIVFALFVINRIENLNQPPGSFPIEQPVVVSQGLDVKSITKLLKDNGVVKSDAFLYYTLILFFDPANVKASTYLFDEPLTAYEVAKKLTEGDFDTGLIRITHYEGERITQLATRLGEVLPNFVTEDFIKNAEVSELEGKLFPETYLVPDTFSADDFLNLLTETFYIEIEPLQAEIEDHPLTLDEILVLASIIEREANSPESMKLVSSVLQNRLEIGMALQADASIEYILNKPLKELTPQDLKIDSPYNTYLYTGLPPTPIGNPGLDAITAVLEPTESEYYYYITDEEGEFHYAETYKQHLVNIEKFLR